ncbi:homeobox protein, putative [Ixodes scapularis]|uniref:Homeobox protein, putative n=1 Tax=Ixodes scapularis TaxID=6945 RepID=B7PY38_IXOSC|nr:homeobox protein, putative [Ixodes scapularis]|eukprot:XP_002402536.1 homeobox protein, putative [Ixodes scapularis]
MGRYFSTFQKEQLTKAFVCNAYPDTAQQRTLAFRLGLTTEQVKVWFANKRTRDRKRAVLFPELRLF